MDSSPSSIESGAASLGDICGEIHRRLLFGLYPSLLCFWKIEVLIIRPVCLSVWFAIPLRLRIKQGKLILHETTKLRLR
jgi:hypothetical protein